MAKTSTARREKIEEALQLLDSAAEQTRDEISDLVHEKYKNLEKTVSHIQPMARRAFRDVSAQAKDIYEKGRASISEKATAVNESVHESPWKFISLAAVASLALGYLWGQRRD